MKKTLLAALSLGAAAFGGMISTSIAEPVRLNDDQMDAITAGTLDSESAVTVDLPLDLLAEYGVPAEILRDLQIAIQDIPVVGGLPDGGATVSVPLGALASDIRDMILDAQRTAGTTPGSRRTITTTSIFDHTSSGGDITVIRRSVTTSRSIITDGVR